MQYILTQEEYEDLKYESREEVRKLEFEIMKLRKENDELKAKLEIYKITSSGIDATRNCGRPPKSPKKGGFNF